MTDLKLGAEFPPARREDWQKLVEQVLKGSSFEKLSSKTYDGLAIEPLYVRAKEGRAVAGRAPGEPWQVMARIDHPDPAAANKQALEDLENGANGLVLAFAGAIGAHGFGVPPDSLPRVLEGAHLDAGISIELDLSPQAKDAAPALAALVAAKGLKPAVVDIRFGFDPLGAMATAGWTTAPWPELARPFAKIVLDLSSKGFHGPFAVADGRVVHDAGGSEAQELAFALAVAVAYLRALEAAGINLEDARRMIFFRLAADADQFLTMAKFRSFRKLWARVEEASGLESKPAFVAAETAWRMLTKRDPYVNMLRATLATFAAGLGGADAIGVMPFTAALGLPDAFARRIARNTQLILREESSLAKVGDPAAGSGGFEDLTAKLCRAAWTLFQEIEAAGGAWPALERGLIQKKVAAVCAGHEQATKDGREPLTGTTIFQDATEMPVAVLDAPQAAPMPPPSNAIRIEALKPMRLGAPFE
jgi:methylmalonyl-CoA mutase